MEPDGAMVTRIKYDFSFESHQQGMGKNKISVSLHAENSLNNMDSKSLEVLLRESGNSLCLRVKNRPTVKVILFMHLMSIRTHQSRKSRSQILANLPAV